MQLHMAVPLDRMPLAACADLAAFLIQTTIDWQRFQAGGQCGVGGPVDVLTITSADGARFVRRKDATPPLADPDDATHPGWQWHAIDTRRRVITADARVDIQRVGAYAI
jgi:hypothetical protein